MNLDEIVRLGVEQKATDIHLEAGLPVTLRVNGSLRRQQISPGANTLQNFAEQILDEAAWESLQTRGSADLCRKIGGVQCRINILNSDRGTGFAIRLLSTMTNTLQTCNLHPALRDLLQKETGLIILAGPTGSGKSTTLSALLEEINTHEARHIITLESPIEYRLQPKRSLIRQREVGRHTPSYETGLLDALREDPDVLVVGEMREAEAMRLTLNAAETGHLVLATMHSASGMDAIYRMMMSFPPERQSNVLAQLGDSLIAIVSHKMTYREDIQLLVPCCEILIANHAVRNVIRKGEVSKLPTLLQTGGPEGLYTFERYQSWLDHKIDWVYPEPPKAAEVDTETPNQVTLTKPTRVRPRPTPPSMSTPPRRTEPILVSAPPSEEDDEVFDLMPPKAPGRRKGGTTAMRIHKDGRIEIPELDMDLNELVKEFKGRGDGG